MQRLKCSFALSFPPPLPIHHFYYVIKRTRYILAAMGSDTRWCKGKRRYLHLWVIYMMTKINTWIFSACRLSIMLTDKINTKPLSLLLKSGCVHFPYKLIYVWIYVLIIALNWLCNCVQKDNKGRVLAILAVNPVSK